MRDFLLALWGTEFPWGELRCIRDGAVHQQFFRDSELDDLLMTALRADADGWDVYMGCLPRRVQSGRAGDCVPTTQALWLDIDSKNLDGTKLGALLALGRSSVPPSIVVDSGNGIHSYHLLKEPVSFDKAAEVMKGLASTVGADHCYDAPRVLRLPGTRNHKSDPPHPVRLLHFEPSRKHWITDFSDYLPEAPRLIRREHHNTREYDELPDWLRELIETPAPDGTRSERIFKVFVWLIRYGWDYDAIHGLILDWPEGFGEKVAEMRDADRWVMRTYRRAEVAALEEVA